VPVHTDHDLKKKKAWGVGGRKTITKDGYEGGIRRGQARQMEKEEQCKTTAEKKYNVPPGEIVRGLKPREGWKVRVRSLSMF